MGSSSTTCSGSARRRLNDLGRCEGTFWSKLAGEGPPFAHSRATAVGVVQHRAIEVVVGAREALDPHDAASIGRRPAPPTGRSASPSTGVELAAAEQDDLLMEVARRTALFEGSFPPLRDLRRELAPMAELPDEGRAARRLARRVGQGRPGASAAPTACSRCGRSAC